jgi:hypothetical protein
VFLMVHSEARNIEVGALHGPFCIQPPAPDRHERKTLFSNRHKMGLCNVPHDGAGRQLASLPGGRLDTTAILHFYPVHIRKQKSP